MRGKGGAAIVLALWALACPACLDEEENEVSFGSDGWLRGVDLDRDGKMSLAEFREGSAGNIYHHELVFRILDFDRDGLVTAEEFESGALEDRFAPGPVPVGGGAPGGFRRAARHSLSARYDTDGDGLLTVRELEGAEDDDPAAARVLLYFPRIDANGDGALTQEEFRTLRRRFGVATDQRSSERRLR